MLANPRALRRTTPPPVAPGEVDGVALDAAQAVRLAKLTHCIWYADTSLSAESTVERAVGALRASIRMVDGAWYDLPALALPGGRRLRLVNLDD